MGDLSAPGTFYVIAVHLRCGSHYTSYRVLVRLFPDIETIAAKGQWQLQADVPLDEDTLDLSWLTKEIWELDTYAVR